MYSFIKHNGLLINDTFIEFLKNTNLADFQTLMDLKGGSIFKKNKFRSVVRIAIEDKVFYLKRHFWPWKERIKSIVPWLKKEDAKNEWQSMLLLENLGFNTMVPVAFGEKKRFGMPFFSLTLTENIYDTEKLETYLPMHFSSHLSKEKFFEKIEMIKKLAALVRDFHNKGLNHQDFYLGHLFIRPKNGKIFIVDIQRVHRRETISMHDRIKDLSQLAFSAKGLGIFTRTDFMRFVHLYLDRKKLNRADKKLIRRITTKVARIEKHTDKLLKRRNKSI